MTAIDCHLRAGHQASKNRTLTWRTKGENIHWVTEPRRAAKFRVEGQEGGFHHRALARALTVEGVAPPEFFQQAGYDRLRARPEQQHLVPHPSHLLLERLCCTVGGGSCCDDGGEDHWGNRLLKPRCHAGPPSVWGRLFCSRVSG